MGKEIGCSFKYNRLKISTPTLKKTILSSSAAHTLYASNSTGTSISSQLDNKDITTNQDKDNTSNTYDIHSCVTPRKNNYSVQATSTSPILTPLNTTIYIAPIELHTTEKLTLSGKEYLYFQINSKSPHAAQCVKSRLLNKAIYYILSIDTVEKQCVVIKFMLQLSCLEDNTKTIGIDQLLCNKYSFEQKCMNNIKNIYQHAGKCEDQRKLKDIIDAAVVSTPEGVT